MHKNSYHIWSQNKGQKPKEDQEDKGEVRHNGPRGPSSKEIQKATKAQINKSKRLVEPPNQKVTKAQINKSKINYNTKKGQMKTLNPNIPMHNAVQGLGRHLKHFHRKSNKKPRQVAVKVN